MANANKKTKQVDHIQPASTLPQTLSFGYSIYDIENADPKWKCIFCSLIMKEPIQLTECGHRCCKGCFESRAADAVNDELECPVDDCHTSFHKGQVRIIFTSKTACQAQSCIFFKDNA